MAVRIRMKMMGRTHRHYFRIVAIDARQPRDGREIEQLGTYDPSIPKTDDRVKLIPSRIKYWMSVGAKPSEHCQAIFDKYLAKFEDVEKQLVVEHRAAVLAHTGRTESEVCHVVKKKKIRQNKPDTSLLLGQTSVTPAGVGEQKESVGQRAGHPSRSESVKPAGIGTITVPTKDHVKTLSAQFSNTALPAYDRMAALVALEEADHRAMYRLLTSVLAAGEANAALLGPLVRTVEGVPYSFFKSNKSMAARLAASLVTGLDRLAGAPHTQELERSLAAGYRTLGLIGTAATAVQLASHIRPEHPGRSQMVFDSVVSVFSRCDAGAASGVGGLITKIDDFVGAAVAKGWLKEPRAFGRLVAAVAASAAVGGDGLAAVADSLKAAGATDWRADFLGHRLSRLCRVLDVNSLGGGHPARKIRKALDGLGYDPKKVVAGATSGIA